MIPKLLQRDPTKRSAIINVASIAGLTEGNRDSAVYCATQAYNITFGKCLHDTYKDRIDVLTITPNTIEGKMTRGPYLFPVEAETFVSSALDRLGSGNYTRGNWKHALEPYALNLLKYCWIGSHNDNVRYLDYL